MAVCPECKGTGSVTLLYTRNPCGTCEGSGRVEEPQAKAEPEPQKADGPVIATTYTTYNTGATTSTDNLTTAGTGGDIVLTGGNTTGNVTMTLRGGSGGASRPSLVEWVSERLSELHEEDRRDENVPEWQVGHQIPVVAPIATATLADMVMVLEQEGEEPEAFVCSCRDFADILKFGDAPMLHWEGRSAIYFGTPILRDRNVPPGYVVTVSKSRKMVLCTVCR